VRERVLIGAGVAAFVAIVTLPVWYNAALGTPAAMPAIAKPAGAPCVLPKEEMRRSHMTLLVDWRERVVRDGARTFVSADGRTREMSLTGTCLACHGARADSCDRCHATAGVQPTCFGCHLDRAPAKPAGELVALGPRAAGTGPAAPGPSLTGAVATARSGAGREAAR
jgi:hypothetical protein